MTSMGEPHIPILRAGVEYTSLEQGELKGYRDAGTLARISQANAGMVRRDLRRLAAKTAAFRAISSVRMLEICKQAGELFLYGTLPINSQGDMQSPQNFIEALSKTSGLPHVLCAKNMQKVFTVFDEMGAVLRGLTRGMDPSVVDRGFGEHSGVPVCYRPSTAALGVVLPSNSPGVNSIWMPAIALKIPVILKPGREEPWTPLRIIQAFIAAGCPPEAFSFYPTDHEGSMAILEGSGRALLFGDASTTKAYAGNPAVQIHGPGRSKLLLGADVIDDWREHLEVMVASVADNGGRSCINASTILVPAHGKAIAAAVAKELAGIMPRAADDAGARLSAFANPKFAESIDAMIDQGLANSGAEDVTASYRQGDRRQTFDGAQFLLPTVIRCDSIDHPLALTEYMFPFVSVVELPQAEMVSKIGPSLVVTVITKDQTLIDELIGSPDVDRVNLGPVPTSRVEWDQPHEGNLFEFLYARRAIQRADGW